MEKYGFYLTKDTTKRVYYKKEIVFSKSFLGMVKEVNLIILDKQSGNVFLKRVIHYKDGKIRQEPFCITKDLLKILSEVGF